MSATIVYYFSPASPWTYLGHARFTDMARRAGASIRLLPTDFGKVFAVSGGLPLGQRAPQRQAYRLVELARFSGHLQVPMNLKPRFFPVAGDDAACLIIAVDLHDGVEAAMRRPLSFKARQIVSYAGVVAVVSLMAFAMVNDLKRYWDSFAHWLAS